MTSETNKLLNLVYPAGYPNDWDYSSNFTEYLLKVGTYKAEELIKEPNRLQDEKNSLQDQTQELAVTNYKTFIETSECSRQLFTQFNTIENKLDELLVDIPEFETKCQEFNKESYDINNLRKLNSLTLTRNAQLLEVLELPQLMNSFIHDGLYEDALELAGYVRKLYNKHSDIPIFKSILDDVNKAWLLMLHQLLSQLRQDLPLPKCLQIVSHLRRMEVFTEMELRLKFLQARGSWLDHCINYIPRDDTNHHLTKTIELTRVNLFNIITQYRAVFSDDEPYNSLKHEAINLNVIFYSWINAKINKFLSTLEDDLKYITSIESIIDQCMYFGLSFSKVGCDFRTLLVPIFTKRISENFSNAITKSMINFESNIEKFTLINKNHPSIPWKTRNEDPLHPPDSLLEFYPLAEYLNNILKAFNELRLCAPIAIVSDVVSSLQKSLIFIAKSLLILYSQEQQAFTSNSKDAFTRLCMCFSNDLVPYVQKCIHIVYPPTQIASKLGVSVQVLQTDKISFLDKNVIVEPVKHLLPAKVEPDFSFVENSNNKTEVKIKEVDNGSDLDVNNSEEVARESISTDDLENVEEHLN